MKYAKDLPNSDLELPPRLPRQGQERGNQLHADFALELGEFCTTDAGDFLQIIY